MVKLVSVQPPAGPVKRREGDVVFMSDTPAIGKPVAPLFRPTASAKPVRAAA